MPNRRRFTALFVLTVFILGARAPSAIEDGNELLSTCKIAVAYIDSKSRDTETGVEAVACFRYLNGFNDGYVAGVVAALKRIEKRGAQITLRDLETICGMGETPAIQRARMVIKYLEERPERLHRPAALVTGEAMSFYFPCK